MSREEFFNNRIKELQDIFAKEKERYLDLREKLMNPSITQEERFRLEPEAMHVSANMRAIVELIEINKLWKQEYK